MLMASGNYKDRNVHSGVLSLDNREEEHFRRKRKLGLKIMGRFGFIGTIASSITLIIGVAGMAIFTSEGEAPYVIPIGIIAGILSLIPNVVGMWLRSTGMAFERSGDKSRDDVPHSIAGKIVCIFVFAVMNFTFLFFCTFGSFYGMALCISDDNNCEKDHGEKLALFSVVAILSVLLWTSCFFFSIWFCVYGKAFGFKSQYERSKNIRSMQRQIRQQQEQISHLQGQMNTQPQDQYFNLSPQHI